MEAGSLSAFTTWITTLVLLTCCDRGFGSNIMTKHECYQWIHELLVIECNSTSEIHIVSVVIGTSFGWTPGLPCPNNDPSCVINATKLLSLCESQERCELNKTIINRRIQSPCQATNFIAIEYTCVSELKTTDKQIQSSVSLPYVDELSTTKTDITEQKSTFEEMETTSVGLDFGITIITKRAKVTPASLAGYCCLGLSTVIAIGVFIVIVRRKLRNRDPDKTRTIQDGFQNGKMDEQSPRNESSQVEDGLETNSVQPPSGKASPRYEYSSDLQSSAVAYDNPAYWKMAGGSETILAEVKVDNHNDEIVDGEHIYAELEDSNQAASEDGESNQITASSILDIYEFPCNPQIVTDSADQSASDKSENGGSDDNKSDVSVLNMPLPATPEN